MNLTQALGDLDEPQSILRQALWSLDDERQDARACQELRDIAEIAHTLVLDAMIVLERDMQAVAATYAARMTEMERELAEDEAAQPVQKDLAA